MTSLSDCRSLDVSHARDNSLERPQRGSAKKKFRRAKYKHGVYGESNTSSSLSFSRGHPADASAQASLEQQLRISRDAIDVGIADVLRLQPVAL